MDTQASLIFVVGYSGAGLRTVINALQDAGFLCIDNLPALMLQPTLDSFLGTRLSPERGLVLRPRLGHKDHVDEFFAFLKHCQKNSVKFDLLFLVADDAILHERYSTTRRKHPFLHEGDSITQAVAYEKDLLKSIEPFITKRIDTTEFAPKDLIKSLESMYQDVVAVRVLNVSLFSFGFKHGPLKHADMVFDVRFLNNPFFVPALRLKTGLDSEVMDFILKDQDSCLFLDKITDFLGWLLPRYYDEGRHYLRVGIGCTGGKHRSVCMVENTIHRLCDLSIPHIAYTTYHRDLNLPVA